MELTWVLVLEVAVALVWIPRRGWVPATSRKLRLTTTTTTNSSLLLKAIPWKLDAAIGTSLFVYSVWAFQFHSTFSEFWGFIIVYVTPTARLGGHWKKGSQESVKTASLKSFSNRFTNIKGDHMKCIYLNNTKLWHVLQQSIKHEWAWCQDYDLRKGIMKKRDGIGGKSRAAKNLKAQTW